MSSAGLVYGSPEWQRDQDAQAQMFAFSQSRSPSGINPGPRYGQTSTTPRVGAFAPQHLDLPVGQLAATGQMYQGMTGDPATDIPKLGDAYNQAYQGALGFNTALLTQQQRLSDQERQSAAAAGGAISGAYDQLAGAAGDLRTQAGQQSADINRQYGQLSSDVLGDIQGIEASRLQDINTQYARDAADAQQNLISRGLANTTVGASIARGLQSDRDRSRTRLANEIADLRAGYRSNLGLAGLSDLRRGQEQGVDLGREQLGYQTRGVNELVRQQEQQVGLGRDFMGYLAGVQAPYPDASMFSLLAQQAGAARQAGADRSQLMGAIGAMQAAAGQAGGAGTLEAAVPTSGGGFMVGTGRGLSGPEANYGGSVVYGGGSGLMGTAPGVAPLAQQQAAQAAQAPPPVSAPYLGAGTGWSGGGASWEDVGKAVSGGVFDSLASMGYGDAGLPEGYYVTDPGYADDFADEAFGFPTFGGF